MARRVVAEVHYASWSYLFGLLVVVAFVVAPIAYMFTRYVVCPSCQFIEQ
jgi:hypothetical protein